MGCGSGDCDSGPCGGGPPCPTTATITVGELGFPVTDEIGFNGVDYLRATPERRAAVDMLEALEAVMAALRRRKGTDQEGRLSVADTLAIKVAIRAAKGEAG